MNLEKRGFRLPTEAEWEIVCRSGTNTAYSFGNDAQLLGRYGWSLENSEKWSHAVGSLRPTAMGLFDIHGNMFEWCHDWIGDYAAEAGADDPIGPAEGSHRVRRGGGWLYDSAHCRTAYRGSIKPSSRDACLGFRIAAIPFSQASEPAREAASDAGSGSRRPEAEGVGVPPSGYAGLKEHEATIPPQGKLRPADALRRLVHFYDALGKPEEASTWRTQLEARTRSDESR